jgi:hypothetical protein
LGSKKSKVKNPVPNFGSVTPPSSTVEEAEPAALLPTEEALLPTEEAGVEPDANLVHDHDVPEFSPEAASSAHDTINELEAKPDLDEASEPEASVPVEEDASLAAEVLQDGDIEATSGSFFEEDLSVPGEDILPSDAAEDDTFAPPDTFDDIEIKPAALEANVLGAMELGAPNSDAQIFDVADLPDMGSPIIDTFAAEEELDTLDDLFQFEDFPTDVPEDHSEYMDEKVDSFGVDTSRFFRDGDLTDSADHGFLKSGKSGFIDDDFSDLRRDITDVPVDSDFVAKVLSNSAAQRDGEEELIPQDLPSNLALDDDINAAFSGMQSIPEEDETGKFRRDETFDFGNDTDDSMLDSSVGEQEAAVEGGLGPGARFGVGDEIPPTEEIPSAVLEDLASPHYASMSLPEAPEVEGFGSPDRLDPDLDDLKPPFQRRDYTPLVIGAVALVTALILSYIMLR